MTVVTTRPDDFYDPGFGWAANGAADEQAAVIDDSDASYAYTLGVTLLSFGTSDPSVPAGAVVKTVAVRVRHHVAGGSVQNLVRLVSATDGTIFAEAQQIVTNTTDQTVTALSTPAHTASTDIDPADVRIAVYRQAGGTYYLTEVYQDTTYVTVPTVAVDAPTGTVSDTNEPVISWTPTLDADGGAQTAYTVRVFDQATFTAGGFDPNTATPVRELYFGNGADTSWSVGDSTPDVYPGGYVNAGVLPDDTYRAYVNVAQSVNGAFHTSAWAYAEFTVSVALPAEPTLTLTPEPSSSRMRIDLAVNAGSATTDLLELQSSVDGGATWTPVRTIDETAGWVDPNTDLTAWDLECANGTETRYRARSLHDYSGVYAASAWVEATATMSTSSWWIKHPTRPSLNLAVDVHSLPEVQRVARQGVKQALGASYAIVVSDTRASTTGTVTLRLDTSAQRDALDALIDTGDALYLHGPAADDEPARYVAFGDQTRQRHTDKAFVGERLETLPFVEVAKPDGPLEAWP